MDKGLMIVFAIGAAFIYFSTSLFNLSTSDDDTQWSSSGKKNPYAQYYKENIIGDTVLDLSTVTLSEGKTIWNAVPTKDQIIDALPDFDLAMTTAHNSLADGKFKEYLLGHLESLQSRFLGGEINGDQAKEALGNLK
jgi:hypothetical protein